MTDGIIQKIFNKHRYRFESELELATLQQELIKEIMEWILDSKTCGHELSKQDLDTSCQECLEDLTTQHDLIGDNQE